MSHTSEIKIDFSIRCSRSIRNLQILNTLSRDRKQKLVVYRTWKSQWSIKMEEEWWIRPCPTVRWLSWPPRCWRTESACRTGWECWSKQAYAGSDSLKPPNSCSRTLLKWQAQTWPGQTNQTGTLMLTSSEQWTSWNNDEYEVLLVHLLGSFFAVYIFRERMSYRNTQHVFGYQTGNG